MNPIAVVALALLLAVASSVITTALLAPAADAGPAPREAVAAERLEEIAARLVELEARVAQLPSAPGAEREPAGVTDVTPAIDGAELERAIEAVLARREAALRGAAAQADAVAAAGLLHELSALPAGDDRRAAVWRRIREGGHVDTAVAEFERRAQAAPFDSMTRTELAWAYFQKMQTTGGGPEAGRWGARGAETLEQALELDASNWDARYSLAQHFYYADMRGDSVHHLERLVAEQPGRRGERKHARAFLLLGNIHFDAGRKAEARKAWEAGLQSFPGDATLLQRLQALQ